MRVGEGASKRKSTGRRINAPKLEKLAEIKGKPGVVIPQARRRALEKAREPWRGTRDMIYPSEMARDDWCMRATYYRMKGWPEPSKSESFTLSTVFAEGNAIHDKWQRWLKRDLWGNWRCNYCGQLEYCHMYKELPSFQDGDGLYGPQVDHYHDWEYREVALRDEEHMIQGRADGAFYPDTLIEFKSLGVGTLRFEAPKLLESNTHKIGTKNIVDIEGIWKNFKRPLLSHVKQVNIYLHMAKVLDLPFKEAAIVYEFKANQQSKEFSIPYDENILSPMLDRAKLVVVAYKENIPPACPYGGCAECKAWEATKEASLDE